MITLGAFLKRVKTELKSKKMKTFSESRIRETDMSLQEPVSSVQIVSSRFPRSFARPFSAAWETATTSTLFRNSVNEVWVRR